LLPTDRALTESSEWQQDISRPSSPTLGETHGEEPQAVSSQTQPASPQPSTSAATAATSQPQPNLELALETQVDTGLNSNILEILGVDPTVVVEYGPAINTELANRLTFFATSGLKKEERLDLVKKYPVPENCQTIAAPELNAEIKAALSESLLKRDKALESRQKSVATVIACLSRAITTQMLSTEPDHELLQQLVDSTRLLCDTQYNDSIARKTFAISYLKKDVKDQLSLTKIGKSLFGDNLGETLKTAKAVSKTGSELKEQVKILPGSTKRNLNWKTTGGIRKQTQGPSSSRRNPAQQTTPTIVSGHHQRQFPQPPLPQQPRNLSNASLHRPRQTRRR
jgi:hypothetical protein